MRRHAGWLIFAALIVLTSLAFLGAAVLREHDVRPLTGSLTVTDKALATDLHTYPVGNFVLTLSAIGQDATGGYQGPRLYITHRAAPGKWLWHTQRGQAFAAAAVGSAQVDETRGSYTFIDSLSRTCTRQTLDAITPQGDALAITGTLDCGGEQFIGYTLRFSPASDNQLAFDLSFDDPKINRAYLTYASDSDEHFFGFGEQYTYFDLKGQRVPVWDSEQGIGRGQQPLTFLVDQVSQSGGNPLTTYAAVPQYITSRMRSLFLENSQYTVFDLRDPNRVQISTFAPGLKGRILYGANPEDLIQEYTAWAGRMRPLPDWILSGAVVGLQGGTQTVREIYSQLKQRGTPVSALWLQDWVGQRSTSFGKQLWWNWELDTQRYPGFSTLVSDLKQDDVRVLLYTSPFLVDVSKKPGAQRNLFKEASEKGYLVKDADGKVYLVQNTDFSAGMLDLTNPAAVAWYQDVLRTQMLALGASGWMADFGEALPYDAVLANGESGADYHNRYPEDWARLNRDLLESQPDGSQDVFFTRSGFSRSPAYTTLMWEGDQLTTWDPYDGIKSAVTGLLSGGISGFSLNHSDIGGYTGISNPVVHVTRSKELLMRWMELSAFTTVYRTHEGNLPDQNAQFYTDAATLDQFDRFARVYAAWGFLRQRLVQNASQTGVPVDRALFINYPNDPEVLKLSYQEFLVGPDILVAPVLDPGVTSQKVYLPAGSWVHVWSGTAYRSPYKGQWVAVAAPIGQPPVFYKEGIPDGEQFVQNLKAAGLVK